MHPGKVQAQSLACPLPFATLRWLLPVAALLALAVLFIFGQIRIQPFEVQKS